MPEKGYMFLNVNMYVWSKEHEKMIKGSMEQGKFYKGAWSKIKKN